MFRAIRSYSQVVKYNNKVIPAPSTSVPDVNTFLTKIGRNAEEHIEIFENDWSKFWNAKSSDMKEWGIEPQTRKYVLAWKERFRQGQEPYHIAKGVKKNGGERNAKLHNALKRFEKLKSERELREKYMSEHKNF
ncbi:hypothetical protein LJB42_001299 [Komagataella kurtzmanii]|nr:hypothetical protein LJB42_001299 [Komagataella kurtzmanii]